MSNITIVLKLLPAISAVVNAVEQQAEKAAADGREKLKGEEKLAIAKVLLEEAYEVAFPVQPVPFSAIVATVESFIAMIVAAKNAIGLFKK